MLIKTPAPVNYPDIVAFVKTKKRINQSSLEWGLWLENKQVPGIIKQLQADNIIGPAYIDGSITDIGDLIYYDVVKNNNKVHASPWWQLWKYKLETGILFVRFLRLIVKNQVIGKKSPLDMVTQTMNAVAKELKVDYRLGIEGQPNEVEYYTVELREPVKDELIESALAQLRDELMPRGFKIKRSQNRLEFSPPV